MATLRFDGEMTREATAAATAAIDAMGSDDGPLTIELADADITDGRSCAALADAIRRAAQRIGDVAVVEAPQVLAHTLYRVGALGAGALQLIDPREEIGTAG